MHRSLKGSLPKLDSNGQLDLLYHRERDGALPSHILCSGCRAFHLPRLPRHWIKGGKNKDCLYPDVSYKKKCESIIHQLPVHFTSSTVAALTRSARHGWDIYPTSILTTPVQYKLADREHPWAEAFMFAKVVEGDLLLKTEIWLYPDEHLSEKGTWKLRDLARGHGSLGGRVKDPWEKGSYIPHHDDCLSPDEVSDSTPTCPWSPNKSDGYSACSWFFTDYQVRKDTAPVPGGGPGRRALVLTKWSDLGSGESLDDLKWFLFKRDGDLPDEEVRRKEEAGRVARKFECEGGRLPPAYEYA